MTGKEKFNLRMNIGGGSIRDERVQSMRNVIANNFADDPSYRDDVVFWNTGKPIPARIYEHKYRDSGTPRRQIQTPYSHPFCVGDILRLGHEGHWLCIEAFNAHEMNYQGTLEYCNYILRFMIGDKIKEYPVVMKNATQYNSGESGNTQMTLGSSQHLIYIPFDKDTILVDNGRRFLIDKNNSHPSAYRLTQVDSTSYNYGDSGYLMWTVVEDQLSIQDNKECMIADYIAEKEPQKNFYIDCNGKPELRVGGIAKRFSVKYSEGNTNELSLLWNFIVLEEYRSFFSLTEQDGFIEIKTLQHVPSGIIGILKVSSDDGVYQDEIEIRTVSGL